MSRPTLKVLYVIATVGWGLSFCFFLFFCFLLNRVRWQWEIAYPIVLGLGITSGELRRIIKRQASISN